MKTILVYLFLAMALMATPDREDILYSPIDFAEYDCCFMIKPKKDGIIFEHKFQSFSEIMDFMREYKIDSLYVRDCEKTTKWRKLTRTVKGD